MDDCVFCKLVNKTIPIVQVLEDDKTLGFLEISPSAPGHSMVILKRHEFSILEYSQEELGNLMASVQLLAKKIKKGLNCDWISIGINHLEPRGVPHLHVHLIPRWNDDGGKVIQGIVSNRPKQTREELAEKIRQDL